MRRVEQWHAVVISDIIMRPIDTDTIDTKICDCRRERDDIESEIERLDSLERDLPDLETDRREKIEELETAKKDLNSVRQELDELDAGVKESRTQEQEV